MAALPAVGEQQRSAPISTGAMQHVYTMGCDSALRGKEGVVHAANQRNYGNREVEEVRHKRS